MRVTCERCLRRYDVPDATVKGRKIRARCKCGARVVVQDEERAARSSAGGSQTTGSIQRPARWFVDITSWEPIAMDLRQLVRAFDGGRIDADTLVWRKGMPDWRRLRDVPELAERLMGAEAAAKAAASETPPEVASAESNPPPPRQPERSRTPLANYSVDDRLLSEHASAEGRFSAAPPERVDLGAVAPGSEAAATLPGVSAVPPTPAGGYMSPTPPRARFERRSAPSVASALSTDARAPEHTPGPSLVGAVQAGAVQAGAVQAGPTPMGLATAFAPAGGSRTITQTGLAPAPEPVLRASRTPAANLSTPQGSASNDTGEARFSEPEPEAVRASPTAGPAQRNSRPPGAARRVPSSDETPAQKPSSISVPSGTVMQGPGRLRGKHLVAMTVLLIGVGLMVRGTLSTDSGASAPAASPEHRALPPLPAEPARVENRSALLAPESAPEPVKLAPPTTPVAPGVATAPVSPPAQTALPEAVGSLNAPRIARVPNVPAAPAVVPAAPAVAAPPRVIKPTSVPASEPSASAPMVQIPASPVALSPERAPMNEPASITGRGELAAPATSPPTPPREPATPPAATPPPASPPATAAPSIPAPGTPAAFDEKRAREQLGLAAVKASSCGQLGGTRGAGQVNVVIEAWGRVARVTHLNQAFVGTPVGLCIMQAFQTVQVPPFQGDAHSLTASFLIQ